MVSRAREEGGFTLPELMVSLVIGMVLVLAAFTLIERSFAINDEVTDRTDSSQRGRLAMEQITRQIRSQVCPDPNTPAIVSGDDYSFRFWAFTGTGAFAPVERTLAFDTTATPAAITRTDAGQPSRSIVSEVLPPRGLNRPVFQYFPWTSSGPVRVDLDNPLPTPLSAANRARVVLVRVSYITLPSGRASNRTATSSNPPDGSTPLSEGVYLRNADPNGVNGPEGATC
jgi:prepilin-type N-terminal cleavage/methylation domain-containing protein